MSRAYAHGLYRNMVKGPQDAMQQLLIMYSFQRLPNGVTATEGL